MAVQISITQNPRVVYVQTSLLTGPRGPSGGETYVFDQLAPSTLWTIFHELGGFPSVTIIDSANKEVLGDVTYIDDDTVEVSFSFPFSGKAYLNM